MKGINYIRKLGRGRFLEYIVSSDYVKNVYSKNSDDSNDPNLIEILDKAIQALQ